MVALCLDEEGLRDYHEDDIREAEKLVDDMDGDVLIGDVLSRKPRPDQSIENVVIVDNIPVTVSAKVLKLTNVLLKIFSKCGKIETHHIPLDENQKTKGYMFIVYKTGQEATNAISSCNGYKLDKTHCFAVNRLSDFEHCMNIPEQWEEPSPEPYKPQVNLKSWLCEPDCYDQFAIVHGKTRTTGVHSCGQSQAIQVQQRENWTESHVKFSPKGSYLATCHKQGIALWGGPDFTRVGRFLHPNVTYFQFSPCEKYFVTYSKTSFTPEEPQNLIIWETRSCLNKRAFTLPVLNYWPYFKWSHDGQYFATITGDTLAIYATPSMKLLDNKKISVQNIRDFLWCPSENWIAYWQSENKNIPARVTIMSVPDCVPISYKNLFSVTNIAIYWQNSGNYLAVKVDRTIKNKKEQENVFEIFRLREKDIPVENFEIKSKVISLSWDPKGPRFALIQGEQGRTDVSFFKIGEKILPIGKTLVGKKCNCIKWSPLGQYCVLAGLNNISFDGVLEFWDIGSDTPTLMNEANHFMVTNIAWDPTGRYVCSSNTYGGHSVENGYMMWNFQGSKLFEASLDNFIQFQWRPRPPSLLKEDDFKEIRRNMKSYTRDFEIKDKISQSKASKELVEKRRTVYDEFMSYRRKKERELEVLKVQYIELRTEVVEEEYVEETIEFFMKEEVESVSKE